MSLCARSSYWRSDDGRRFQAFGFRYMVDSILGFWFLFVVCFWVCVEAYPMLESCRMCCDIITTCSDQYVLCCQRFVGMAVLETPASVKKHSCGEEDPWENQLQKHQIRGWRGVSAAVLQGKGSRTMSVCLTDTGMILVMSLTWAQAIRHARSSYGI